VGWLHNYGYTSDEATGALAAAPAGRAGGLVALFGSVHVAAAARADGGASDEAADGGANTEVDSDGRRRALRRLPRRRRGHCGKGRRRRRRGRRCTAAAARRGISAMASGAEFARVQAVTPGLRRLAHSPPHMHRGGVAPAGTPSSSKTTVVGGA
jgi:hypothetical protein